MSWKETKLGSIKISNNSAKNHAIAPYIFGCLDNIDNNPIYFVYKFENGKTTDHIEYGQLLFENINKLREQQGLELHDSYNVPIVIENTDMYRNALYTITKNPIYKSKGFVIKDKNKIHKMIIYELGRSASYGDEKIYCNNLEGKAKKIAEITLSIT